MNSHHIAIAGYLGVLAAVVVLQAAALASRGRLPPLGDVFTRIMRNRTGRVGVLIAWAWIGLHFFAR